MPDRGQRNRDDLLARLRRIQGQVRGIARMVEQDQHCTDVLTQISAVTAALERVGLGLLREHVRGCLAEAAASGEGENEAEELVSAIERFVRV